MAGISSSVAALGGAKQTGLGVLPAGAVFGHGVAGGTVANVEVEQEKDDVTSGSRDYVHVNRKTAVPGVEVTTRAFPKAVGFWLYAALGAVATTGPVTTDYTHVLTGADVLPYVATWAKYGADVFTIRDALVDELTLSWDGTGPLELALTLLGTLFGFTGTYAPTNDEATTKYLVPAGGSFKLSASTNTPVVARIKGGSIGIGNNVEPIVLSGSVVPVDTHPGRRELTTNLTLVPTDLAAWRETLTGSTGGTSVSEFPVEGSFEVIFKDPSAPSTRQLKVAGSRVPFSCKLPEANPDGSPAELALEGVPVLPTSGPALTFTLVNGQTAY